MGRNTTFGLLLHETIGAPSGKRYFFTRPQALSVAAEFFSRRPAAFWKYKVVYSGRRRVGRWSDVASIPAAGIRNPK